MNKVKKIQTALISVWDKNGLSQILKQLNEQNVQIISTGGTAKHIEQQGYTVETVETITDYPSILNGRVKTLHPKIFGGILGRRENETSGATNQEIIEKIDIGGISLIRAAAKNYEDVLIIPSKKQYKDLSNILANSTNTLATRRKMAGEAFKISSHYDTAIAAYFTSEKAETETTLRYGENPHQKAYFKGNINEIFTQLHGKEISYNNLLDIDSAISLIAEFEEPTCAVLKHTNPCGLASDKDIKTAWVKALQGDPLSAFGGIIVANREINKETAEEINKLFFEVIIAPEYNKEALEILKSKKNRRILLHKKHELSEKQHRTILNGTLLQERDKKTESPEDLRPVTNKTPDEKLTEELLFANKIVKHTKSNAIVLTKNKQLCASGVGQTSRIDALKQAIEKAQRFGFDLENAVMASDAFFPFADSVETAHKAGITAVIQPGGSIKDQDSIDYCNKNNISMVFTGIRHFKH